MIFEKRQEKSCRFLNFCTKVHCAIDFYLLELRCGLVSWVQECEKMLSAFSFNCKTLIQYYLMEDSYYA